VLFGNDKARRQLKDMIDKQKMELEPITPQAVKGALWLSLYGFDDLPNGRMDGAYDRPCVIAELYGFDTIFAVRPLAQGWRGKAPASWFDVQDWNTEMWFSAGYNAEVAELRRINELIDKGYLQDPRYRKVELIEVLTDHPAGYFNFFSERPQVFQAAYREAMDKLRPFETGAVEDREASSPRAVRLRAAPA
jgi:hypothetical protein